MKQRCESCGKLQHHTVTAVVNHVYYRHICSVCLGGAEISSNAIGYDRRRQYEDHADETVQPYNASGPNIEFARLYPRQAEKIYPKDVLDELKRKM